MWEVRAALIAELKEVVALPSGRFFDDAEIEAMQRLLDVLEARQRKDG
jgi:hypothetical protein